MEELSVEVLDANGAYYKVNFIILEWGVFVSGCSFRSVNNVESVCSYIYVLTVNVKLEN